MSRQIDVTKLLNPTLYRRLQNFFGAENVTVSSPGVQYVVHREGRRTLQTGSRTRPVLSVDGEHFIVRGCPYCGDKRFRLEFHYTFGDPKDTKLGRYNAHCFNEDCLAKRDPDEGKSRYVQMLQVLFDPAARRSTVDSLMLERDPFVSAEPAVAVTPALPNDFVLLDELHASAPDHAALAYLRSRGFDPVQLAKHYGIGFCEYDARRVLCRRIIIPIHERGQLIGYQARAIVDKPGMKMKYFTMPGFSKTQHVYNMDRALTYRDVVIVEGVTGTWRLGGPVVAIFGKSLHASQVQLLSRWSGGHVVVLLDPEVAKNHKGPHQIEVAAHQLSEVFPKRVVTVYLPEGRDSGNIDRDWAWSFIYDQAAKQGVPLDVSLRRT